MLDLNKKSLLDAHNRCLRQTLERETGSKPQTGNWLSSIAKLGCRSQKRQCRKELIDGKSKTMMDGKADTPNAAHEKPEILIRDVELQKWDL